MLAANVPTLPMSISKGTVLSDLLKGKIAIITGAGSGIGKAMAFLFAEQGATVIVTDISGKQEVVAKALGGNAKSYRLDVGDEREVSHVIDDVVAKFGRIDVVCNNAAMSSGFGPLHETSLDVIDNVFLINLRGAFVVLQRSIAHMLQTGGGTIVNTASLSSFHSTPGHGAYAASKGGVMSMTRSAAIEYADRNIRVNALCPGVVETPMISAASVSLRESVSNQIPMRRFGTAEEMAKVALFLASDQSSYVTGVGLVADGGRSAG